MGIPIKKASGAIRQIANKNLIGIDKALAHTNIFGNSNKYPRLNPTIQIIARLTLKRNPYLLLKLSEQALPVPAKTKNAVKVARQFQSSESLAR